MKRLIAHSLLFAALTSLTACQATKPYTPEVVSNVIEVDKSQSEIYNKVRQWFSEFFVSGESVIDYEDASTGTIIGNGISQIGTDPFGLIKYKIHYTIRVDTKDGKFKSEYKITKHTNTDSNSTYDVNYVDEERLQQAKQHVESITSNLKEYINKSSENW